MATEKRPNECFALETYAHDALTRCGIQGGKSFQKVSLQHFCDAANTGLQDNAPQQTEVSGLRRNRTDVGLGGTQ